MFSGFGSHRFYDHVTQALAHMFWDSTRGRGLLLHEMIVHALVNRIGRNGHCTWPALVTPIYAPYKPACPGQNRQYDDAAYAEPHKLPGEWFGCYWRRGTRLARQQINGDGFSKCCRNGFIAAVGYRSSSKVLGI